MGPGRGETIERWTANRRAALVLRVLKGETSVAEAARQHGLRRWPKDKEALKDEQIKEAQTKGWRFDGGE